MTRPLARTHPGGDWITEAGPGLPEVGGRIAGRGLGDVGGIFSALLVHAQPGPVTGGHVVELAGQHDSGEFPAEPDDREHVLPVLRRFRGELGDGVPARR